MVDDRGQGDQRSGGLDHRPIQDFIRLDSASAAIAMAMVFFVNLIAVQVGDLYWIVAALGVLIGLLVLADRLLRSDHVLVALALISGGNWGLAILVTVLLPWLLPVMVLTIVMPLVLAIPHLDSRQLAPFLVTAMLTIGVAGLLGISNDDGGVVHDIDDGLELLVVVGGMMGHAAPIGLIVWQANLRHRQGIEEANRLNGLLSDSRRRLVEAADAERTRLERNLHDGAQQRLISVGMQLRMLRSEENDHELDRVIAEVEGAMTEIRDLSHGMSPPLLELQGLPAAIAAAARQNGSAVTLDLADIGRYERAVETALYFCCMEALQNIAKHAPRAAVTITVDHGAEGLRLAVADDGPGFDPGAVVASKGTVNMADRIGSVGGAVLVRSEPGRGTTVTATVPNVTSAGRP